MVAVERADVTTPNRSRCSLEGEWSAVDFQDFFFLEAAIPLHPPGEEVAAAGRWEGTRRLQGAQWDALWVENARGGREYGKYSGSGTAGRQCSSVSSTVRDTARFSKKNFCVLSSPGTGWKRGVVSDLGRKRRTGMLRFLFLEVAVQPSALRAQVRRCLQTAAI